MKTLIHYKLQRIEELINKLLVLNKLYISRSFTFDTELLSFMEECETLFEQLGENSNKSKVSQLTVYFEIAKKGVNPLTLEKLRTGKRENSWIAAFHVLDNMSTILQDSIDKIEFELNQSRELIEQVVLSAIQSKMISESEIKELSKQESLQMLWKKLTDNEQVKLVERKLKLTVTQDDIFILLDKVFTKINA